MIELEKTKRCVKSLLVSSEFNDIYKIAEATIQKYSMLPRIKNGVLIGFSGGADSVMALIILKELSRKENFCISCLHVNHGIRGAEADRDERFSAAFCQALEIPFFTEKADVPEYARKRGVSLELGARELRYSKFYELLTKSENIGAIVTAHNSTDNLETVVFNLTRGAGTAGLAGISPVRDEILRPLIEISKAQIVSALDKYGVEYMTDSTNNSDEYTRNFIRHEILPKLHKLNPCVEHTTLRLGENLRGDNDCLLDMSRSFFNENFQNGAIDGDKLRSLHKSLFARVLKLMTSAHTDVSPEKCHIDKIYELLYKCGDFAVDIQSGLRFVREENFCKIIRKCEYNKSHSEPAEVKLSLGENKLPEYECLIYLSYDKNEKISSNVYKFSTQASIPNDIIIGDLRVRSKKDGDSYVYGGMTRKVKKLFNDRKIPAKRRENYPIICDNSGILYIPSFGIRDNSSENNSKKLYISIYDKYEE